MPISKKSITKAIKTNKNLILLLATYSAFFGFITFFIFQRMGAFGCFDDCFNFGGGFFLNKGQTIYKDFFFNHGFIAAYISAIIQRLNPLDYIQGVIISHRIFIYTFSFIFGWILIIRFRQPAFMTLVFYEALKFYTFGDRFLAESMIIYPIIYLTFLVWEKLNKREIWKIDYLLSGLFVWFIIFSREPYAPVTFFLYFLILITKGEWRIKIYSVLVFVILTFISFIFVPINYFYINVFTYNRNQIGSELGRNTSSPIFMALYPFIVFIKGQWNILRQAQILFSAMFLATGIFYSIKLRRIGFLILFIVLALANTRPNNPGFIFYEAYRTNIWFGLLLASTFLLIFEAAKIRPRLKNYLLIPFFLFLALTFVSKYYFINEHVDKAAEFNLSYSQYHVYSEVIKKLSQPGDKLFLEAKDEVIYPLSNRPSAYKYNWYTSFMPTIPLYQQERDRMIASKTPDYYYDACILTDKHWPDPKGYTRIKIYNEKSCLLIKNDKLKDISQSQWDSVFYLGFTKP